MALLASLALLLTCLLTVAVLALDDNLLQLVKFDVEGCAKNVNAGREALARATHRTATHHYERRTARLEKAMKRFQAKTASGNATFALEKGEEADGGATTTTVTCSKPLPTLFPPPDVGNFMAYPILENTDSDPFMALTAHYHKYLDENAFCRSKPPSALNAVSEAQVMGYLSTLAVNHADYLCPICHRLTTHFHNAYLKPRKHSLADDETLVYSSLLARIPDAETVCATALPVCSEDYAAKAINISKPTVECLECNLCNTAAITVLQSFILNPQKLAALRQYLSDTVFMTLCAELCLAGPLGPKLGWNNQDEKSCNAFLGRQFDFIMELLKRELLPNQLCGLVLGFCKPNEAPNILHCVKDLCNDLGLGDLGAALCPLIPDEPEAMARFLNIELDKKPRRGRSEL